MKAPPCQNSFQSVASPRRVDSCRTRPSGRRTPYAAPVPFPSPPWPLRARAWLSLFAVRGAAGHDRPAGLYGVAFVDYRDGGVLTYRELLVARPVRSGRSPQVRITDIWVDSPVSREGGRALWAIPKELADLPLRSEGAGTVERTSFSGAADGRLLASASFVTVPRAAVLRLPFRTATSQPALDGDGPVVVGPFSGSACGVPSRASWRFDERGPLGFLAGRRPVASLALRDASVRFG